MKKYVIVDDLVFNNWLVTPGSVFTFLPRKKPHLKKQT